MCNWIILFLLFCGGYHNGAGFLNNGCGCGNDMIQPRGFAGFGDNNTCGCEEKEN